MRTPRPASREWFGIESNMRHVSAMKRLPGSDIAQAFASTMRGLMACRQRTSELRGLPVPPANLERVAGVGCPPKYLKLFDKSIGQLGAFLL